MSAKDSSDKKYEEEHGKNNDNNDKNNRLLQSLPESPTLATRYAHRAATLVHSIEKNSYLIISIIIALFILSTLDLLEVHGNLPFSFDPIITFFSAGSIVALFYMVRMTLKSKRVLESWADVLEKFHIDWNKYFNG